MSCAVYLRIHLSNDQNWERLNLTNNSGIPVKYWPVNCAGLKFGCYGGYGLHDYELGFG